MHRFSRAIGDAHGKALATAAHISSYKPPLYAHLDFSQLAKCGFRLVIVRSILRKIVGGKWGFRTSLTFFNEYFYIPMTRCIWKKPRLGDCFRDFYEGGTMKTKCVAVRERKRPR